MADDARRTSAGRAAIRWAVLRVPLSLGALVGVWWFAGIWWIVVYGPILFTPLRQGLHDRAAGVVVINSRFGPERWSFANVFQARRSLTTNRQRRPHRPHRPGDERVGTIGQSCECRT